MTANSKTIKEGGVMGRWPVKYRFWGVLHRYANMLAWKFADPGGKAWGKALRIDKTKLLWRLNDWVASHYIHWWVAERHELRRKSDPQPHKEKPK